MLCGFLVFDLGFYGDLILIMEVKCILRSFDMDNRGC